MKLIYLAHPVSGDVETNVRSARAWYERLTRAYLGEIGFVADWLLWVGAFKDEAEFRIHGLAFDCELAARCDGLWCVGPRLSAGMLVEANAAHDAGHEVLDLTGEDVGRNGLFSLIQIIDARRRWLSRRESKG